MKRVKRLTALRYIPFMIAFFLIPAQALAEGEGLTGIAAISAYQDAWKNAEGQVVFPDDYAGAYLDEAQHAVLLFVGLDAEREAELRRLVPNADVTLKSANYTLDFLMQVQEEIPGSMAAAGVPLADELALGVGVNEAANRLEVTVADEDVDAVRAYCEANYGGMVLVKGGGRRIVPQSDEPRPPQTGGGAFPFGPAALLLSACVLCAARGKARRLSAAKRRNRVP